MDTNQEVITTERKGNSSAAIIIVVLILVVIGVLVLMGGKKDSQNEAAGTNNTTAEPTASAMEDTSPTNSAPDNEQMAQAITVEGSNFSFKPNEIRAKKGEKVTITFKNAGGVHDFVIADLDVKTKQLKDGESETVEFTPDKAGTYEFFCSVGNHRAMGMKGTLIVE